MTNESLIAEFLVKNKKLIKVSGVESAAKVPSSYWAKIICGAIHPGWFSTTKTKSTLVVLTDLRNDIDKLLKQIK
jgi:hypothetical protein